MSRDAAASFVWGDGEQTFRLRIGQLREIQEKCDAGPAEVLQRLRTGRWRVDDVRETIRLGLIGGGKKPEEAFSLVRRYVDDWPWLENVLPAVAILTAALVGVPDEPLGEPGKAVAEQGGTAPTGVSASPTSTATAPSSDTPPSKSTECPSGNSPPASKAGSAPTKPRRRSRPS